MNRFHRWYCRSARWQRAVEHELLPWVLRNVDLGDDVLEIGPGPGLTTAVLARTTPHLTAVEIDAALARALQQRTDPQRVTVVHADATALPYNDNTFTGAVCFTMLHHVPTVARQDALLREVRRVLKPGATFAGSDSRPSVIFRAAHLFDTMTLVDPATLSARLTAAGFTDATVSTAKHQLRFRAHRP